MRGGANLDAQQKEQLKRLNEELSLLQVQFGENVLKETNRYELVVDDAADLAGLPEGVIEAAAEAAAQRGHEGKWVFTLHKPSFIPFLQYAENRDLREQIFLAYAGMGDHGDELDNKAILVRIADLRAKRAQLLGFPTHAAYVLDDNMAKTPEAVYALLDQLWTPAVARAEEEVAEMQAMIDAEGGGFQLEPWDWWYYAEKVKKARYDLDEEMLRPYFELRAACAAASSPWPAGSSGCSSPHGTDIPVYHEDVKVFEVQDADGATIGLLMTDYFPRASKRGGAWMNAFRSSSATRTASGVRAGDLQRGQLLQAHRRHARRCSAWTRWAPCSTSSATPCTACSRDCRYAQPVGHQRGPRLRGAALPDHGELGLRARGAGRCTPRHYKTGEPIPDELIDKIAASQPVQPGLRHHRVPGGLATWTWTGTP